MTFITQPGTLNFELLYQTRTHHNAKHNHNKAMTYKTRILKDEKKFAYKRQTTINLVKEDHWAKSGGIGEDSTFRYMGIT